MALTERLDYLCAILVILVMLVLWCWKCKLCKDKKAKEQEGYINGYVARDLYGQFGTDNLVGSRVPTGLSWRKGDSMAVPSMHEISNRSTYNRFKIDKKTDTNPHLKWAADATVGVSDVEPVDGFSDRKRMIANVRGDVVTPMPHSVAQRGSPSLGGEILTQTDYSVGYVPSRMIST